jgi:hypothetical protein
VERVGERRPFYMLPQPLYREFLDIFDRFAASKDYGIFIARQSIDEIPRW